MLLHSQVQKQRSLQLGHGGSHPNLGIEIQAEELSFGEQQCQSISGLVSGDREPNRYSPDLLLQRNHRHRIKEYYEDRRSTT